MEAATESNPTLHAQLFAEQPELSSLLQVLRRVQGFSLYFARCDVPSYRIKLTEAISQQLSRPIVVVDTAELATMNQTTRPAIDGFVEKELEGVSEDAVVFITGLENLLPSRDEERMLRTAAELNWRRGFFQRMRRPMVFWLPGYALTVLARNAPDLYDWYSGVYEFDPPAKDRSEMTRGTLRTINETEGRRWMPTDERDRWEDVLQELLANAEANSDPNNLSQAEAVEQSDLLDRIGQLYHQKAEYQKAKEYHERALQISEAAFGPNHPNVATRLNNLASVLKDLGELQHARDLFERSLNISEAAFGPNHPNVATSLNNLASVLQDLGELQHARDLFERSLNIDEAAFGPNHPNVATSLNNLASVLQDLGDLQQAKTLLERSLGIFRQFLGENHPNTKTVKKHLDAVLKELGEADTDLAAPTKSGQTS